MRDVAVLDAPRRAPWGRVRVALVAGRVQVAWAVGLLLVAGAVAIAVTRSPVVVLATNGIAPEQALTEVRDGGSVCQAGESLPGGTSAIRLSLFAPVGPRVAAQVLSSEGQLLAAGARGSGWTTEPVTVPVTPLPHPVSDATICFTVAPSRTELAINGSPTAASAAARAPAGPLPGRVGIEYLRTDRRPWWRLAVSVARRMGLGRAVAGTWVAPFALVLMLVLAGLVTRLVLGELAGRRQAGERRARVGGRGTRVGGRSAGIMRRVPGAAWRCALVASLNAACWSFVSPPFQVVDEPSHFAYVQLLVENHQLPASGGEFGSAEERTALTDLRVGQVSLDLQNQPISSRAQQRKLEADLAASPSRQGSGGAGTASSEPPLYYTLEAVPYELGTGSSLLGRLQLMRLLSALLAGVTALFAYLFVREALPGSRWAWTVGGLAVALFPLLGAMSGAVNPDAMLFAVCSASYYLLARAFRRGLTRRLALAIGLLTAVGLVTKLNFIGFAPGILLGLVVLSVRTARRGPPRARPARRAAYGSLALALALALTPVALDIALRLSNHSGLDAASGTLDTLKRTPFHEISYIWQLYLPRLPGMPSYFPGVLTPRQFWFNGLVGLYGWDVIPFPNWAYDVALIPAGLIAVLCLREVARRFATLRRRKAELAIYCLLGVGVLTLVGTQSYNSDVIDGSAAYWEPRYLLPMLALWGLVATLAARGAGRRWGPVVGALLIALFLAHDVLSQLQVIGRFYG